jgi:MarR family transcriptional regulator, organic hydroperoxide resistance regulator
VAAPDLGAPSTGYLVWHLSVRWQVQLSRALGPLGITHTDYAVLASLRGLAQVGVQPSQRELADVSGLEPMYVSKLVRSLERAGLVERRPHPADPRANQLSLTDRGDEIVTAGRQVVAGLEDERLAALGGSSSERAARFKEALADLLHHARATSADGAPPSAGRPTHPEETEP